MGNGPGGSEADSESDSRLARHARRPRATHRRVRDTTRDRSYVGWQRVARGADRTPSTRVEPAPADRSAAEELAAGPDDPRADPVGCGGAPDPAARTVVRSRHQRCPDVDR